ncbi:MAG: phage regulatory CII family protein, partial [Phycisphaerae bacterium]
ATGAPRVIHGLCTAAGGFFVQNPHVVPGEGEEQLLTTTERVVADFGDLLGTVSRGIEDDGQISGAEADHIRQAWETLKTKAECFVVACERGMYLHNDE